MVIRFGFEENEWEKVSSLIDKPTDYFDFPSSLLAFAYSLKNSRLRIVDDVVFFRERGKQLTLISYFCPSERLMEIIKDLSSYKIKSLNYVNKDFNGIPTKQYMNEYWVDRSWDVPSLLGGTGRSVRRIRTKFAKSEKKYEVVEKMTLHEVTELFEIWYKEAQKRHFMVVRGHYLTYIHNYFKSPNNVQFVGFRDKNTNKLMGIGGYEIFKNQAQITLTKHHLGDNTFCYFLWIKLLEKILTKGVSKVFCGSTADDFKQRLKLEPSKSYKLVLNDN